MQQSAFSNFKILSDLSSGFKKVAKQKELPSSRFSILNGKIEKYRERKLEAEKKLEKSNESKMQELQKQQQARLSPADQMRENFNAFANMNFAGNNNSAALPGIKAVAPITNKVARMQLYRKLANTAQTNVGNAPTNVANAPTNVGNPSSNVVGQNDYSHLERMITDPNYSLGVRQAIAKSVLDNKTSNTTTLNDWFVRYGGPVIKALGWGRSDDNIQDSELVNIYSSPNSYVGNLNAYDTSINRRFNIG